MHWSTESNTIFLTYSFTLQTFICSFLRLLVPNRLVWRKETMIMYFCCVQNGSSQKLLESCRKAGGLGSVSRDLPKQTQPVSNLHQLASGAAQLLLHMRMTHVYESSSHEDPYILTDIHVSALGSYREALRSQQFFFDNGKGLLLLLSHNHR